MSTLSWSDLFNNGSIVALNTSLWRARIKLRAVDLGIEVTKEVRDVLSFGTYRLAPAKAFDDILEPARRARGMIDDSSVNFGLIRGARFVPADKLPDLIMNLEGQKTAYYAAVESFLTNYDTMRDMTLPTLWSALCAAAKTTDDATRAYERIQQEYPAREEVAQLFALSWSVYAISAPKNAAVAGAVETEASEVKGIVSEMVKELHGEVSTRLQEVIDLIAKGGRLSEKTLNSTRAVLDRVDSLNIFGDQELSRLTRAVRGIFDGADPNNLKENSGDMSNFVNGLADVQAELTGSVAQAAADAEAALTGLGRRRFAAVVADTAAEMGL